VFLYPWCWLTDSNAARWPASMDAATYVHSSPPSHVCNTPTPPPPHTHTGALQEVERPLPPGWHLTGPMGVTRAGDTGAAPRVEDPTILEFLEEAQGQSGCGYCRGQGGCAAAACLTSPHYVLLPGHTTARNCAY
jgi:hypothetical protein